MNSTCLPPYTHSSRKLELKVKPELGAMSLGMGCSCPKHHSHFAKYLTLFLLAQTLGPLGGLHPGHLPESLPLTFSLISTAMIPPHVNEIPIGSKG